MSSAGFVNNLQSSRSCPKITTLLSTSHKIFIARWWRSRGLVFRNAFYWKPRDTKHTFTSLFNKQPAGMSNVQSTIKIFVSVFHAENYIEIHPIVHKSLSVSCVDRQQHEKMTGGCLQKTIIDISVRTTAGLTFCIIIYKIIFNHLFLCLLQILVWKSLPHTIIDCQISRSHLLTARILHSRILLSLKKLSNYSQTDGSDSDYTNPLDFWSDTESNKAFFSIFMFILQLRNIRFVSHEKQKQFLLYRCALLSPPIFINGKNNLKFRLQLFHRNSMS